MKRSRAVVAVGVLVAAGAVSGFSATTSASDYRDASGLLVISASRDQVVDEAQRDQWAAYDALTEANPDEFSYASPNLDTGAVEVGVVTRAGDDLLASFSAGQTTAPPAGSSPAGDEPYTGEKMDAAVAAASKTAKTMAATGVDEPVSRRQVEAIKDELIGWALDPAYADAGIWQTSVEKSTGKVILSLETLTPTLAAAVATRYGTEAVVVEIGTDPDIQEEVGRPADGQPFYGGAKINTPAGQCSDAFAWRLYGGTNAMLTAGHCVPNGGSVSTPYTSMGGVTKSTYENWNEGTGTVSVSGFSGYHGDGAVIVGKTSGPYIYRGSSTSSTSSQVMKMWSRRAAVGDSYCTGGAFSGENCGWTVNAAGVNVTTRNSAGVVTGVLRNAVRSGARTGWCTRPGDSGGSVFTFVTGGVAAKGVHHGGSGGGDDHYGGMTDPCTETFTDIWDIFYGLPGYLAL